MTLEESYESLPYSKEFKSTLWEVRKVKLYGDSCSTQVGPWLGT